MLGSHNGKCTLHNSNNELENLNIESKGPILFPFNQVY